MNPSQLLSFAISGAVLLVLAAIILVNVDAGVHHRRYKAGGMDIVDKMSQTQFGQYLEGYFKQKNCKVTPLEWPTDKASAFLLINNGESTFVYAERSEDGIKDDAVHLVIEQAKLHNTSETMIITNCVLLQSAEKIALAHRIKLLERHALIHRMGKAKVRGLAEQVTQNV